MSDPNKPEDDQEFLDAEFDESFDDQFDEFSEETLIPESYDDEDDEEDVGSQEEGGTYDPTDDTLENFGDEEWEDFGEEGEFNAASEESSGKKKLIGGLSFNAIVIAGAVVVGVGVLIFQVMTAKPQVGNADRFRSPITLTGSTDGMVLGEDDAQQQATNAESEDNDVGFLNDPSLIEESQNQNAVTGDGESGLPMPVPMANDAAPEMAAPDQVLTPMPGETEMAPRSPDENMPPQEAPPQNQSAAMDVLLKARQQNQETQQPAPQQSQEEPPAVQQEPVEMAPETAVPAMQEQQPDPAPVSDIAADNALEEENSQLRGEVSALTDRLEVMQQEMVALKEGRSNKVSEMEKQIAALKSDLAAAQKAKEEAPRAEAAPPKKAASAPKPAIREPAYSPPAQAVRWELRAAQPGRAWVSKAGSREMQTVQVGDSLAGLGQVTRIEQIGDRWSVVGTQGRVDQ